MFLKPRPSLYLRKYSQEFHYFFFSHFLAFRFSSMCHGTSVCCIQCSVRFWPRELRASLWSLRKEMLLRHSTSESIGSICFSFLFIKSFGSFIIFCSSKIHYFRAIWLLSIFIYVRILKKAEILSAFYCSLRFCSLNIIIT